MVSGAGASGIAVSKILLAAGVGDIAVADSKGLIYDGRDGLNPVKAALAKVTNAAGLTGSPEAALRGADVFIGLSGSTVAEEAMARMAPGAIVVPAVQPRPGDPPGRRPAPCGGGGDRPQRLPEPDQQLAGLPRRVPCRARRRASTATERMKLAAADAIAALVGGDAAPDYVIPSQFDERVAPAVAAAVAAAARADGVARR